MFADSRKQSAGIANPAGHHLLGKARTSLIPAVYGDDKAFVSSWLTALFHTIQWNDDAEPFVGSAWRRYDAGITYSVMDLWQGAGVPRIEVGISV